ncbi:DUF2202 domain-containing protein [Pontiellaceae bacterium B12227]|nr:DUF2202 domain-containing protein [Pontiellaceae bacterium B12227]
MDKHFLLLSVLISAICLVGRYSPGMLCTDYQPGSSHYQLTTTEANDLQYTLESVKLARDLYLTLNNRFESQVFSSLPKAEIHQLEAVQQLCSTYGQQAEVETPGEFRNESLKKRYDVLITRGTGTHRDALLTGALIEEIAIADFRAASQRTSRDDLRIMYEQLYGSSIRHFRSVVKAFESRTKERYVAQNMSAHAVDSILGR